MLLPPAHPVPSLLSQSLDPPWQVPPLQQGEGGAPRGVRRRPTPQAPPALPSQAAQHIRYAGKTAGSYAEVLAAACCHWEGRETEEEKEGGKTEGEKKKETERGEKRDR